VLPAARATGDLKTSRFLLSLQDRHASVILYFDQSSSASARAAAAAVAFYDSEEALRAEMRTICACALRPSRVPSQYGIGVFVSGLRAVLPQASSRMTCHTFSWRKLQVAVPGHEYNARDNITLKITIWSRAVKVQVPQSQRVIGDSPPHASAFGGQLLMPLMNAPIEVCHILFPIAIPVIIGGKGADQLAASLCAWEV
jgi:hypothetical protein